MTHLRWLRLVALVSVLALVLAACGDDDDEGGGDATTTTSSDAVPEGDGVLKIGYLLPETGALAFLGPPMIEGVKMAVEEINDQGGVLGQPIELVAADDGTDPDVASAAVDRLINEGVDVIVGAAASGVSISVIDKITDTPIVQCSSSNTGLQFTTYDDGGYYFRTAPPDNLQSQVMTDLISADGAEKVQVIAQSTEYGEGFANALVEELNAAGIEAPDPILYDAMAGSYQAEATQLADSGADSIVLISYDEGATVIQAAIAAGIGPGAEGVQWYGADGIQSGSFWEKVDPSNPAVLEGVRGTAPSYAPEGGEATFGERFAAFAPEVTDTIYSAHSYDCVAVAALAAIAAGSDAAQAIQPEMNGITKDGEKCSLFSDCVELLEAGTDIDYDGAAGPLEFIEAGEPGEGIFDTWAFDAEGAVTFLDTSISVGGE
jgi:branched-chain amino acid transport system substrate-binding protein